MKRNGYFAFEMIIDSTGARNTLDLIISELTN